MIDFDVVAAWLIAVVCGGGMIFAVVWGLLDRRKKNQQILEEMEKPVLEIPLFECKATVAEKLCQRENKGGVKMPSTCQQCYLVVKTPDGKLRKCAVTLEEYCSVKENQEVTVALENDRIFGINFE